MCGSVTVTRVYVSEEKLTKRDDERRRVRVRLRLHIFGRPAVQGIPIQSLQQALTSALRVSVPGKSGQPGKRSRQIGMLPAADVADRLPLADRVGNLKASRYMQLPSGSALCFESDDDASPAGGLSEAAPSSRATHMSHGQGDFLGQFGAEPRRSRRTACLFQSG